MCEQTKTSSNCEGQAPNTSKGENKSGSMPNTGRGSYLWHNPWYYEGAGDPTTDIFAGYDDQAQPVILTATQPEFEELRDTLIRNFPLEAAPEREIKCLVQVDFSADGPPKRSLLVTRESEILNDDGSRDRETLFTVPLPEVGCHAADRELELTREKLEDSEQYVRNIHDELDRVRAERNDMEEDAKIYENHVIALTKENDHLFTKLTEAGQRIAALTASVANVTRQRDNAYSGWDETARELEGEKLRSAALEMAAGTLSKSAEALRKANDRQTVDIIGLREELDAVNRRIVFCTGWMATISMDTPGWALLNKVRSLII